ncbi:MAG: hypothetical protein LQ351_006990 [Letrouitia transgressa]|nr:MAG: hypothetical protein LQ351_006990 [Letrouitia transgressa]
MASSQESEDRLHNSLFSPRSRRQLSLTFAGATFVALSLFTTRRAITRKKISAIPLFYQPSYAPPRVPINGRLEALEALTLATLNLTSVAVFLTGGLMWAFDVEGFRDLEQRMMRIRMQRKASTQTTYTEGDRGS